MDVTEVPFNKMLGVRRSSAAEHLLELGMTPTNTNHLGTVHAAAQFALAEASSAECLLRTFPELVDEAIAVVRRAEAKYKTALRGTIRSRGEISGEDSRRFLQTWQAKQRGFMTVRIDVVDETAAIGMTATFEWFLQVRTQSR